MSDNRTTHRLTLPDGSLNPASPAVRAAVETIKAARGEGATNASTVDAYIDGRQQGGIGGALRVPPAHFTPAATEQWLLGFDDAKDERWEALYYG